MADGTARAEVFSHFRAPFAVDGHIVADQFQVDIVQQAGQAPLVFILVETFGLGRA